MELNQRFARLGLSFCSQDELWCILHREGKQTPPFGRSSVEVQCLTHATARTHTLHYPSQFPPTNWAFHTRIKRHLETIISSHTLKKRAEAVIIW